MKPTFTLSSPETGTVYHIFVHSPETKTPVPAVLFLDGDDQFAPAIAAYQALCDKGQIPPLLLVGVGYGASYTKPANRRGRDYTPVAHSDEPSSGGGDAFLRFFDADTLARAHPALPRRSVAPRDRRALAGRAARLACVVSAAPVLHRSPRQLALDLVGQSRPSRTRKTCAPSGPTCPPDCS